MQLALYRAERPEVFEDIIGQKHIVKILQNYTEPRGLKFSKI